LSYEDMVYDLRMASEILTVPEDHLSEVIRVIRAGLEATKKDSKISKTTRTQLAKWCDEEEEYLSR